MHDVTKRATLLGMLALLMWVIEPLLISEIQGLPIFELLTIIFFSSFLVTAYRLTINKRWGLITKHPKLIWLIGILGICFSDFAYVYGAQFAPIAHVDLIDYIWPCLVIIFTSLLPNEKFTKQHMIGALLGFSGIYILVFNEINLNGFNLEYFKGYTLALIGALFWGGYCAFSRHYKNVPTEMIGMYCGIGAVICCILHLKLETFVVPSYPQASLAILTGITGAGIAYQLWDYGVKFGNIYLLSSCTYLARILAMALLVSFGKEPLSLSLVVACILGSLGVFVSSINAKSFHRILKSIIESAKGAVFSQST